jgi:hypothetical protein
MGLCGRPIFGITFCEQFGFIITNAEKKEIRPQKLKLFIYNHFYTQTLLHTDAFTHRRFYTQKLLHTNTFTHRDRTHDIVILPQFLAIEPHLNRNFTSIFGDRTSFRTKGFAGHFPNRNFTSVYGDRTSFRAKGLRLTR